MPRIILLGCMLVWSAVAASHAAEVGLLPGTSRQHGITVTVTPQNLKKDAGTWDFEVKLETHVHALDEDMAKISMLVADGKQHAPLEWQGEPPGGHHRKGVLRFEAIEPLPSSVTLQIRLTGEAAPRIFQWSMKGVGNVR